MAVIISSRSGRATSFMGNEEDVDGFAGRVTLRLDSWLGFEGFKAIITGVQFGSQCNFQFMHTLGGMVYLYVFGERMGQLAMSGLAFDAICTSSSDVRADKHGIEFVKEYYDNNNLANRKTPITVTIGQNLAIAGYLAGLQCGVVTPIDKRIYQFDMQLMVPPTKRRGCSPESSSPASSTASSSSPSLHSPAASGPSSPLGGVDISPWTPPTTSAPATSPADVASAIDAIGDAFAAGALDMS